MVRAVCHVLSVFVPLVAPVLFLIPSIPAAAQDRQPAAEVVPLRYNNPGLVVDLGVGLWAWPLPMDYDRDGDPDLVVVCPDVPFSGTWFFENTGRTDPATGMPVLEPPVRVGPGMRNLMPSYAEGQVHVMAPAVVYRDFPRRRFPQAVKLPLPANVHPNEIRANQWRLVDYDGDGQLDLLVGVGDWTDYGWDDAYDAQGRWTRGPLHGYVYLVRNEGTTENPRYAKPEKLRTTDGRLIDTYGMPSPNLADFDGDGDLDLICGEFVDRLWWFENVGTRTRPAFAPGRPLRFGTGQLRMPLCMIVPVAFDWNGDGHTDLVVGQEDGRVALMLHTGRVQERMPVFAPPRFFRQRADRVKFGALVTPVSVDWDGDGDEDLLCGNTAGEIGWIENLDGGCPPRWAAPRLLKASGQTIRIQAGPNGSIQGPCETKWGYTTLSVADWDLDGRLDLVVNTIWGRVVWYRNVGYPGHPRLAGPLPVRVRWPGKPPKPRWTWWDPKPGELVTQWRTTPVVVDWDRNGLPDLVMLDHEGYLAWWPRRRIDGRLVLLPPQRVFQSPGPSVFDSRHRTVDPGPGLLRLNAGTAGRSGRRKLHLVDWDGDGRLDLLVNSTSVHWFQNQGKQQGRWVLVPRGPLCRKRLAGHTTSPTTVDWDRDGVPELLIGAEDGHLYWVRRQKK